MNFFCYFFTELLLARKERVITVLVWLSDCCCPVCASASWNILTHDHTFEDCKKGFYLYYLPFHYLTIFWLTTSFFPYLTIPSLPDHTMSYVTFLTLLLLPSLPFLLYLVTFFSLPYLTLLCIEIYPCCRRFVFLSGRLRRSCALSAATSTTSLPSTSKRRVTSFSSGIWWDPLLYLHTSLWRDHLKRWVTGSCTTAEHVDLQLGLVNTMWTDLCATGVCAILHSY